MRLFGAGYLTPTGKCPALSCVASGRSQKGPSVRPSRTVAASQLTRVDLFAFDKDKIAVVVSYRKFQMPT